MTNWNGKVALFDFCETLVNFQSADAYVDYVRERTQDKRMCDFEYVRICLRKFKVIQIIDKITRNRFSINKRLKLWQLRGCSCDKLSLLAHDYYIEQIKPNLIPEVLEKLFELKKQGYSIFLVSGGYDIYLKLFVQDYDLSGQISTKLAFHNGKCTGTFDGVDCIRNGKIRLLNRFFKIKPLYSVAFSDSKSDIPFLNWVDKGCVISRNQHQQWIDSFNYSEIIWRTN